MFPFVTDSVALLLHSLLRLTVLMENSPIARIYLRASGGLARLASAAADAAVNVLDPGDIDKTRSDKLGDAPAHGVAPIDACVTHAPSLKVKHSSSAELFSDRKYRGVYGERDDRGFCSTAGDRRLELMMFAIAAALEGGERLAQQEVWRSGLLERCGQVLKDTRGHGDTRCTR